MINTKTQKGNTYCPISKSSESLGRLTNLQHFYYRDNCSDGIAQDPTGEETPNKNWAMREEFQKR